MIAHEILLILFSRPYKSTLRLRTGLAQDGHRLLFRESTLPRGFPALKSHIHRKHWLEKTGQIQFMEQTSQIHPRSDVRTQRMPGDTAQEIETRESIDST